MPAAALLFYRPFDRLNDAGRAAFQLVASGFPRQCDQLESETVEAADAIVRVWNRGRAASGLQRHGKEGWLAITGSADRNHKQLRRTAEDAVSTGELDLSPPFAAVARRHDGSYLAAVDRCGLQHLYAATDSDEGIWLSSCLLALAGFIRPRLDHHALAEWLAVGHFLSERTIFSGIRKLGCGERIVLTPSVADVPGERWRPAAIEQTGGTAAKRYAELLRGSVQARVAADVVTELTGGLDTRAVLAAELAGGGRPSTWTLGQAGCDELRAIARLHRVADFDHLAVDVPSDFGSALPELVVTEHELSDGEVSALEYAPLLLAYNALTPRASASITGSGGEIARGFYYSVLRRNGPQLRGVPVDALHSKVTSYAQRLHRHLRRELLGDDEDPARTVIADFVRESRASTPNGILDDFYLRARMQRFAGRNATSTGFFYRQETPFFDDHLVDFALSLPLSEKRGSRAVRRAIELLAPKLVTVPLDTGAPTRSPSARHPRDGAAQFISLARRALVKYGGARGRAVAHRPPGTIPWQRVYADPGFRNFVGDHLLTRDSRIHDLIEPSAIPQIVAGGFKNNDLYPAGLLLTLELTLRRIEKLGARVG